MVIGAIFDWDGVIIDSSSHHKEGWERLAAEEGLPLAPLHFEKGFGMRNEQIIPQILRWTDDLREIRRLSLRKEELYRQIIAERGIELLPGVRSFLDLLHDSGIPCALGTSTHRVNVDVAFDILNMASDFSAVITSEDVSVGKPDPQVFLLAASRLNIRPGQCVVFEDVPAGIEAAKAGGMKAVAVTTTHSAHKLSRADLVVRRLDEITLTKLHQLMDSALDRPREMMSEAWEIRKD